MASGSSDNKNAKNISPSHNVQTNQTNNTTSGCSSPSDSKQHITRSSLPVIDTLIQISNDNSDQESVIPFSTNSQLQHLSQIPPRPATRLPPISAGNDQG